MRFSKLFFIFSFTLISINLNHAFAACTGFNPEFSKTLWTNFSFSIAPITTSANQAKTAAEVLAVANMIQSKWTTIQAAAGNLKAAMPHFDCLTSPSANASDSKSSTPYKPDPEVTAAMSLSQSIITSYNGLKATGNKIMTLNPETTTVMKQLVTVHPLPTNGPWNKSSTGEGKK